MLAGGATARHASRLQPPYSVFYHEKRGVNGASRRADDRTRRSSKDAVREAGGGGMRMAGAEDDTRNTLPAPRPALGPRRGAAYGSDGFTALYPVKIFYFFSH